MLEPDSALLIIDVQRDFCAGGALAVPDGDRVVPPLNDVSASFRQGGRPVYFSRDWHPARSAHFTTGGGPWPVHCVADTEGAQFHRDLRVPDGAVVISKGQAPAADGYSAFEGQTASGVPLARELEAQGIGHLYVGGLATDYCVQQSVLDARRLGFEVTVLTDAVAGVEMKPGDSDRALERMRSAGASFKSSAEIRRR